MSGANQQQIAELAASLRELNLLGRQSFVATPISGGVSCDVFLFEMNGRDPLVVKQALPKLKVEADWRAPVTRAETEVAWIALARSLDARIAPQVIAQDTRRHLFVMSYLPKSSYPVWKEELAAGQVDVEFAAQVGCWLARIHASTAGVREVANSFHDKSQFFALRLEPYLARAATNNPDVSAPLGNLIDQIGKSQIALMQGDISPKNILHGPETPVFLDAETACYGDPAFDLAFCLNHLLLKCVWHPEHRRKYADAFRTLARSYASTVTWEPFVDLDHRAANILAALLLARIDGKSPVEYLVDPDAKNFVRGQAKQFLRTPRTGVQAVLEGWMEAVEGYFARAGSR